MSDTIFALSSGQGRAGIAVIRMSGPGVRVAFQHLCGKVPEPRKARLMAVKDPQDGSLIDRGICLFFAGPRSFTGEDMGEFQLHGGRAVVAGLLAALGKLPGFRPADAGEFTRRAFVNGRLDLVEVEALGDVINAETKGQLKLAQRLAGGDLSRRIQAWRDELVSAMALVEALIDFSDEADVDEDTDAPVTRRAEAVLRDIEQVLDDQGRGERLRDGVGVVIAGPPNAGKSTLLNLLSRREAAIVSPIAGTTRDVIEVQLDLAGVPVSLADTAGLREGGDSIESIGVERARARIAGSDLVLWLEPAGEVAVQAPFPGVAVIRVATKADLAKDALPPDGISVSAVTGFGIEELVRVLTERVRDLAGANESVLITHARQRSGLSACAKELRGLLAQGSGEGAELRAERLRLAIRALERLSGRVDVEDVLGEIFASFCVGK
ncbi:tRNA modification GTPase trmE [Rhizobiales bacterium GAS188]|nr:tRNA modification GTPase trmE [Rhizobiales bacterium GAS188]